ncbi:MAG: hypothetical protein ACOC4M_04430 [Promethearchaeia archaeon]
MKENTLSHYSGKLYHKDSLEKWELPQNIKDQMQLDKFDYFFLASSKEEEHGQHHIHLTFYPSEFEKVYLLEVETGQILPQLLHKVLEVLKRDNCDIVTSTGYCTHVDLCHFGVFFSTPEKIKKEQLLREINSLEKIRDTGLYRFTCQGLDHSF